jgi:hypothetical protein
MIKISAEQPKVQQEADDNGSHKNRIFEKEGKDL